MANDLTNKFLSIEMWVPFILAAIAGLIGYGSLSAEVEHKADKTDVAIIKEQLKSIAKDVETNKTSAQAAARQAQKNYEILIRLESTLTDEG